MLITNKSDISLEMAVWLLYDDYDYVDKENYISATTLLKPIRHILLPARIPEEQRIVPDVENYIASAMGTALHAGVEKAWSDGRHRRAMKLLGYPQHIIDRVLVNPEPLDLVTVKDAIPVYLEQRAFRKLKGWNIGGKFDMVCDGVVCDTKSTSVWNWITGDKDEDYKLQGSIYRWLNPDKITSDYIRINFIFTDWKALDARTKADYPPRRVMHRDIPLMSLEETERWIAARLDLIERYKNIPESELPECTDDELWLSDPIFKYYLDPSKTAGKCYRKFDNALDAHKMLAEKGKGVVLTVPGEPKRCAYCSAFPVCSQKDKYFSKD